MIALRGKGLVWVSLLGCIGALSGACGGAGGDDDDDDTAGSGATGASGTGGGTGAGTGGTTAATGGKGGGGTGGGTMVGGTGGKGGGAGGSTGGTGGTSGTGEKADCSMAGAAKEGSCKSKAKGVYAMKITLDTYWSDEQNPDAPIIDPGRGDMVIYLMGRIEDLCEDGSNGVAVMRACGSELPAFSSSLTCDAYQLQFDPAIWDKPDMPLFKTKGSSTGFEPGDTLDIATAIGLVGVVLDDEMQTWPTAAETPTFPCMAGAKMGTDCFPDQDGDGEPGITVTLKVGGTYMPDNCGDGEDQTPCECPLITGPIPFTYRGSPTSLDVGAAGGLGGGVRAAKVHIGLRTTLGGSGVIAADCASGGGPATAPETAIQSRVASCHVDPASVTGLAEPHPMDACSGAEATFVDENVPNYHIMQKDAKPPAAVKNQAASPGPLNEVVRIGELDASFSCADVRAAFE